MIQQLYQDPKNLTKIRQLFAQDTELPSVQLPDFLEADAFTTLLENVKKLTFTSVAEPMHASFLEASDASEPISALSPFLEKLLGKSTVKGAFYMLGWKHYTLLHDEAVEKPGIDVIFDLTPLWEDSWGGQVIYVDGTGEYRNVAIAPNTLTITQRNKGVQKFIHYINHHAQGHRLFFMGTVS